MKKVLLGLGVTFAACSFSLQAAQNAYTCVPAPGSIDMEAYPGGIGAITLDVTAQINRDCALPAVLYKNGEVLKAIPASNARMAYCIQEYDKVTVGTPVISFFNQANSPASQPGQYAVKIPSNYMLINGEPSSPVYYEFSISGSATEIIYNPANKSTISELNTITLTFDGVSRLEYQAKSNQDTNTGIYYELTSPEGGIDIKECTGVTVDGNVATITFEPYSTNGSVRIYMLPGVFRYKNAQGVTGTTPETSLTYYFGSTSTDGYTVYPAPYTMKEFLPYEHQVIENTSWGTTYYTYKDWYFKVSVPEGYTPTAMAMMTKISLQKADQLGTTNYAATFTQKSVNADNTISFGNFGSEDSNGKIDLAPGEYYFVIPPKSFSIKKDGKTEFVGTELKFGPYIVEGDPITYTVSPEDVVTEISKVTITFPEGSEVAAPASQWFTIINNSDKLQYEFKGEANGNVVTINIDPAITTPGEYVLSAPTEAVTVNGRGVAVDGTFKVERSFISEVYIVNNGVAANATLVTDDPEYDAYWKVDIKTPTSDVETASLTFELPHGYDSVYALDLNSIIGGQDGVREYIPAAALEAEGYKKLADNTLTDIKLGESLYGFAYGKGDEVTEPTLLKVYSTKSGTTGIEVIDLGVEAEYYTLQGVRVANPDKGIYIMVVDGKACKVNVR